MRAMQPTDAVIAAATLAQRLEQLAVNLVDVRVAVDSTLQVTDPKSPLPSPVVPIYFLHQVRIKVATGVHLAEDDVFHGSQVPADRSKRGDL